MYLTAVDLFCGCGGLSRGLSEGGFDVSAGIDAWDDAIRVYAANTGHDAIVHDLSDEDGTVDLVSRYAPFLIAGGPPCQDFSSAGHRKEGDRADLTVKYARVISRSRPEAFIMENVARAQLSAAFASAVEVFRAAGYGLTSIVLNASHCGVPQLRKRLFLIGMLGEPDDFLRADLTAAQTAAPMTLREYLGDEIDVEFYYRHPRTYERRAIFSLDEPSPTIRGINRPMPPTYKLHSNDAVQDLADVRSLTIEERARIQTFPAGYFDVDVPKAAKEQMIGNAVPVELSKFVATALYRHALRVMAEREAVRNSPEAAEHLVPMPAPGPAAPTEALAAPQLIEQPDPILAPEEAASTEVTTAFELVSLAEEPAPEAATTEPEESPVPDPAAEPEFTQVEQETSIASLETAAPATPPEPVPVERPEPASQLDVTPPAVLGRKTAAVWNHVIDIADLMEVSGRERDAMLSGCAEAFNEAFAAMSVRRRTA